MKKKAIKIAASTAVAASAFVAAAPAHQADAATNVDQLVIDAQNAGTVLKWAISLEGSANFVDQPWDQYNAAKKAIAAVEAAYAKLSVSEKLSVDAKLVDAKLQVKRAAAYIDAITSSDKIKDLTAKLDAAIASNDIEKVEAAYHTATAEYRKQVVLLDRVYGQSTRDGIRNAVKPAIEKSVASVKNEVTVNMLVKAADADVKAGKLVEAYAKIADAQAILDANKGKLKWEDTLKKSVGEATTGLPALPGNIAVETVAFHGETGNAYPVVATFKTTNGVAYNGPVKISFDKAGYEFNTVNGAAVTSDTVYPINGQLVLTVKSAGAAVAGGKVKFETFPDLSATKATETKYSGTLNFYDKVDYNTQITNANGEVRYVDPANNYFVTTDLRKFTIAAAGSVYLDTNGSLITFDAFKAKLKKGDVVNGDYYYGGGSTLKIAMSKQATADFVVNQLDELDDLDLTTYRVEGNTITLSGTGEAGKVVSVYNTALGNGAYAIAQVLVPASGVWSVNVAVPASTTFEVRQAAKVNELPLTYGDVLALATPELSDPLTVVPGKFTAKTTTPTPITVASGSSLTGTVVTFNADIPEDGNKTVEVASNASITLVDGSLLSATYVNGVGGTVIESDNAGFKVTFGTPTTTSQVGKALTGQLSVSNVTGVTNAFGFKLNIAK